MYSASLSPAPQKTVKTLCDFKKKKKIKAEARLPSVWFHRVAGLPSGIDMKLNETKGSPETKHCDSTARHLHSWLVFAGRTLHLSLLKVSENSLLEENIHG